MTPWVMPWKDRTKHNDYARKRYREDLVYREAHKERVTANNKRVRFLKRAVIAEWRADGCRLCGEMEPCCLAAHHLDPQLKEDSIGTMVATNVCLKKMVLELEKCVCLCHNCHAKVHAGVCDLAPVAQVVRAAVS